MKWITHRSLEEYDNGFFNWTMSYRLDADVYLPYYSMRQIYDSLPKGKAVVDAIVKRKIGIAVGFIYWNYHIVSKTEVHWIER